MNIRQRRVRARDEGGRPPEDNLRRARAFAANRRWELWRETREVLRDRFGPNVGDLIMENLPRPGTQDANWYWDNILQSQDIENDMAPFGF